MLDQPAVTLYYRQVAVGLSVSVATAEFDSRKDERAMIQTWITDAFPQARRSRRTEKPRFTGRRGVGIRFLPRAHHGANLKC